MITLLIISSPLIVLFSYFIATILEG